MRSTITPAPTWFWFWPPIPVPVFFRPTFGATERRNWPKTCFNRPLGGTAFSYLGLACVDSLAMLFLVRAFGELTGKYWNGIRLHRRCHHGRNRAGHGRHWRGRTWFYSRAPPLAEFWPVPTQPRPTFGHRPLPPRGYPFSRCCWPSSDCKRVYRTKSGQNGRDATGQPMADAFEQPPQRPRLGLLILISFLSVFVFAGMETTFAMWSRRTFGWGPEQNGYLFAFVGVVSAAIQGGLGGTAKQKIRERPMVVGGGLFLAIGLEWFHSARRR